MWVAGLSIGVLAIIGSSAGAFFAAVTDDTEDTDEYVKIMPHRVEYGMWIGAITGGLIGYGGYHMVTSLFDSSSKEQEYNNDTN